MGGWVGWLVLVLGLGWGVWVLVGWWVVVGVGWLVCWLGWVVGVLVGWCMALWWGMPGILVALGVDAFGWVGYGS